MKKKAAAKLKKSAAKPHKTKPLVGKAKRAVKAAPPVVKRISLADDPRFAQAVQNYEAGLRLLQEKKFDRAKAAFLKVVSGPSKELADRVAVYLNACNQAMARTATSFKSLEEHYDFAVALINQGDYDAAREHLEKLAKQYPKTDYVWYGLATLSALQSRSADTLKYLDQAIRLNAANRIQARNDTDFQNMLDDPRFTELLYPEASDQTAAPGSAGKSR